MLDLRSILAVPLAAALLLLTHNCVAGDWPQILGPNRDGKAVHELAIPKWSESGPQRKWSRPVGQGYAGPAVVGDQVILFHRVGDVERLESLNAATGDSQWKTDFAASYQGGVNPDLGPRCVPLVHDKRVYAFGAAGDLYCVKLSDGEKQWTRAAYRDFSGQEGYFGAGASPIVAADKLIVNVGGRGAGLVAFELADGKTAWQATDEAASYSSPTLTTIDGKDRVVFVTRLNVVAINPENGDVRFRFPFGSRGPTVNGATPLVIDDHLFVSASYGVGANWSRISDVSAKEIWASDEVMSSQYSTCVYRDGFLYGTHGREDYSNGVLRCVEVATGEVKWTQQGFGVAHTILIGDQLLILTVDGALRLVEASPSRYRQLASAQVSSDVTRALPALSNGKFYFRDNAGQSGKLVCLQLAE